MDLLLSCYPHDPKNQSSLISQFKHRQELVERWAITPGCHFLEIGCGQGECSLVLAQALGPKGSLTAIDPAAPTYGSPITLGQAQSFIKQSKLGEVIHFQRTDATNLLQQVPNPRFDGAVLCHSLWYFDSTSAIRSLFQTLARAGIQRLYLAEYAGQGELPAQAPHILAVQAQKYLSDLEHSQDYSGDAERNVRTALLPNEVVDLAASSGWALQRQGIVTPSAGLLDGYWEVSYVLSDRFLETVKAGVRLPEEQRKLCDLVEKLRKTVVDLKAEGVERAQSMDVWWAEFSLSVSQS